MPLEHVGYRRLYDSIGCSLSDRKQLQLKISMGETLCEVYMGPKPILGIDIVNKQEGYLFGDQVDEIQWKHHPDARKTNYPRQFFTEIMCYKQITVSKELSEKFHTKDAQAADQILKLAEREGNDFKKSVNLIAGMIGLRYHQQFVLKEINENYIAKQYGNDYAFSYASPSWQLLESVILKARGIERLERELQLVGQAETDFLQFAESALAWLLRAWTERDVISKFMALFIPIEIILQGHEGDSDYIQENQMNAEKIRSLLKEYGGSESKTLSSYFERLVGQQRPSLVSRFTDLAKEAKIPGWEYDVAAFKKYNKIRNKLMHRGDPQVQILIESNDELQNQTSKLEDIAERYVNWALFRDYSVYQNHWRPERKNSP